MKLFAKHILILLLSTTHVVSIAQTTDSGSEIFSYSPTPQTASFMRNSANAVNQNTGALIVNIPIYTYNDNDFNLPISAVYTSQGFIPSRQTGILGLNWFLECGGSVSREIQGIPDDNVDKHGTLGILLGTSVYSEEQSLEIVDGQINSDGLLHYTIDGRETTSDIYHFKFCGHSGTFHFDGSKELHIYNTDGNNYTYTITPIIPENDELCSFVIQTADGYEYTFGAKELIARTNSVERTISGRLTGNSVFYFKESALTANPITTWNLTKIKAPNGREVIFEYETVNSNIGTYINSATSNNPFLVTTFTRGFNVKDDIGVDHFRSVGVVQTSYLKKILIDNCCEINFSKSLKEGCDRPSVPNVINSIEDDHYITQRLMRLDSISVFATAGNKVHSTTFTYKEKENRLMLVGIATGGIGNYTMAYHEESPFPAISSADVDYWGFYNGKCNDYNVVSATKTDTDNNDYIDSDSFNPDWRYSRLGCLKRITYPTGGFTTFEYEPNRASEILLKRKNGYQMITPDSNETAPIEPATEEEQIAYLVGIFPYRSLFYNSDECGGVRIARTYDYDGQGGYSSRMYTYSGGIVYSFPKHYTTALYTLQIYNPFLEYPANSLDRQHISYSTVNEIYADGSSVKYHYSDYHTHPDEYTGQSHKKMEIFGDIGYSYYPPFINNILRSPNSNYMKRGRITGTDYYDSNNNLVKKITYEYAMHDTTYTAYVVTSGKYASSVKRYTGDYRLVEINESEYVGNNSMTTTSHFTYDNRGRIVCNTITHPDGRKTHRFTEFYDSPLCHIFNKPASESTVYETEENKVLANVTKHTYAYIGGMLLQTSIEVAQLGDKTQYPCNIDTLPYTTQLRFIQYDTYGNPTEIVDKNNIHTAIQWGYSGRYPVATVRGMRADTLQALIGVTANTPITAELSISQRSALLGHTSALADIYEYEPLVGLKRHYSSSGNIINYEYDIYGRLIRIFDNYGNIERYTYRTASGSTVNP